MAEVRLNDLVTGSFIKNTQRFSTTPHLIPVQVYVEGKDDICFGVNFYESMIRNMYSTLSRIR